MEPPVDASATVASIPSKRSEAPFEDEQFFVAVPSRDSEDRPGVKFASGADRLARHYIHGSAEARPLAELEPISYYRRLRKVKLVFTTGYERGVER